MKTLQIVALGFACILAVPVIIFVWIDLLAKARVAGGAPSIVQALGTLIDAHSVTGLISPLSSIAAICFGLPLIFSRILWVRVAAIIVTATTFILTLYVLSTFTAQLK